MPVRPLLVLASLLIATLLDVGIRGASAQDFIPGPLERSITRNAIQMLPEKHLLKLAVDQPLAERALDEYFRVLDPWKLYFLQSDVDRFQRRRDGLADQLQGGDCSLAFEIYRRFMERLTRAEAVWKEALDPLTLDFTTADYIVTHPQARAFAGSEEAFREQWRQFLKHRILTRRFSSLPETVSLEEAAASELADYLRTARFSRRKHNQEVLEYFLGALTSQYDHNTSVTTPLARETFEIGQRGNLVGVGVSITADLTVDTLVAGGPAQQNGQLRPKDQIVGVGEGEQGAVKDVTALTLSELVPLIRGNEGTIVRLAIKRPGEAQQRVISLKRARVFLPAAHVDSRVLTEGQRKFGYLGVPMFYRDTASNDSAVIGVRKALDGFRQQQVDCVILDLRDCTGGYLDQSVGLTGLFVGKGRIYQSRDQSGKVTAMENTDTDMAWNKGLVVLVGRNTASGAELLCAAIQDYRRGLIVGDDVTNGHGLVGSIHEAPEGAGMLKATSAQFYRLTGGGIARVGVTPDVLVPSAAVVEPRSARLGVEHPESARVAGMGLSSQNMVAPEMILTLRAASRARQLASPQFQLVRQAIDWKQDLAAFGLEDLQESQYRARRENSPVPRLKDLPVGDNEILLREACVIAAEYVQLLGTRVAAAVQSARSPSTGTPDAVRQRTLANQREAARQAAEQLELRLKHLNDQVVSAQGLVEGTRAARDAASNPGAKELAELAVRAAQAALDRMQAELRRSQTELDKTKADAVQAGM